MTSPEHMRECLQRLDLPLTLQDVGSSVVTLVDLAGRYRISVSEEERDAIGLRWTISVSVADGEDDDALAKLDRLPTLSTSQHQLSPRLYRRWAPFSRTIANSEPRRAPEWVAAALTTITERLALPTALPPEERIGKASESKDIQPEVETNSQSQQSANFDEVLIAIRDALRQHPEALRIVSTLFSEKGFVTAGLVEEIVHSTSLKIGEISAIIATANRGLELNPAQGKAVVLAALSGDRSVGNDGLSAAWDVSEALFSVDTNCIEICNAIRTSKDDSQSLIAFSRLSAIASASLVLHGGRQLLKRPNATKSFRLDVLSAATAGAASAAAQLLKEVLDGDLVAVFDVGQSDLLRAAIKSTSSLLQQVAQAAGRSGTVPDLTAALVIYSEMESEDHTLPLIRKNLTRFIDKPASAVAIPATLQAIESSAIRVLEHHLALGISSEARQDAALLRRLVQAHAQLSNVEIPLSTLELALSKTSPAALAAKIEEEKRQHAMQLLAEHLGSDRNIVVVGGPRGELAKRIIEEFNVALHQVVWKGITKDRKRGADWITEPIKGSACAGVIVITGEVGHRESGLAKDQAARSGKPVSECERGSRGGLTSAFTDLAQKLQIASGGPTAPSAG